MEPVDHKLSHLDNEGQPRMVDVSAKPVSERVATAEAVVLYPQSAWAELEATDFVTKKGALRDVAIVAGTFSLKRTADMIPFCHTIPIEGSSFSVVPDSVQCRIVVQCTVKTRGRTGVEMEALVGASTAALTLYDMTKSLSHEIEITGVRLLSKRGGKSDYQA